MSDIFDEKEKTQTPDEVLNKYFDKSDTDMGKPSAEKRKKSNFYRNLIIGVLVVSVCLGSICFGFSAAGFTEGLDSPSIPVFDKDDSAESEETEENTDESINGDDAVPMSMSAQSIYEASLNRVAIIKNVKPSVVAISTVVYAQDFFFGTRQMKGSGSGFVYAKDATNVYIATNNHVISGATDITVSFNEDTPVTGKVIGTDQNADLAVVAVSAADLKAAGINQVVLAKLGSSADVKTGDPVIAIGNAIGEGITVTSGIISAISKEINLQGKTLSVIQTDAAINEGNSGGPLFNSKGEVIGINTAKFSSETIEGVGFAITSDIAGPIFERLASGESTPTLGVTVQSVPAEYSSYLGATAGAYVTDVVQGGNADIAGIKEGDVITSFNGKTIFGPDQLVESVRECSANDVVNIAGFREGKSFSIRATLYPPANN